MEEKNLIQERLLNAFNPSRFMQELYQYPRLIDEFKDFEDFENAVKDAVRTSLPDCYTNFTHLLLKNVCLDIASKSGQTAFVKILLDQGTKTNIVNKTYNRAPIHFATEGGHVDTLRVLLTKPTNLNLQATEQYQTALHIAVYRNDENCVRLLLKNGANANIPNRKGLSAIYLAARNGHFNVVKLILKEHWQRLYLDNYWDQNYRTIKEVIYHMNMPKEQLMELEEMIKYLVPTRNYRDLKYYLMVNDETSFLNMQIDESYSSIAAELLKKAADNNFHQAVKTMLNWLKERKLDEEGLKEIVFPAARMAIKKGHYVILRNLLNFMPKITKDLIMESCQKLLFVPSSYIANWLKCMKVMLNQGMDIHGVTDKGGLGPLDYAVLSGYDEIVSLFLKQDCYIGHINIVTNISDGTLSRYLDDCVQLRGEVNERESVIEFNYRCLMPDCYEENRHHESEMFLYIANNSRLKHLLNHPLLSSFVYFKWCGIRYFVRVYFFLYLIFYLMLNGYVLSMGIYCPFNKKEMPLDSKTVNSTMNNFNSTMDDSNSTIAKVNSSTQILNYILCIISAILLTIFSIPEILQIYCKRCYYLKEWMNGLKIMLFVLSVALICGAGIQIGIAVTLLSTWELMIVISQISPRFSTSIMIFRTVFYNFIQLFAPYMIFIVVFSMIFYVFYKDSEDMVFSHPTYAILKTILMLIGDFGIDNTLFDSHYSIWSRLVLVIFVFLIVILLMNMLNALTVSNTAEILSQAMLFELIYRIELIAYLENIACMIDRLIIRYRPNIINMEFYINLVDRIFLFGSYLEYGGIKCRIYNTGDYIFFNYGYSFINKMDNDIIERAKQIAFARSNLFHQKQYFNIRQIMKS